MTSPKVAIIGAGYAGLACAVELARHDIEVTVFERSHTLGGRARVVKKDGWTIDNGQHLLLGAYTELLRLLRLTASSPRALHRLPLTLHVPGQLRFRAAPLPAPFHLAWGLASARGLGLKERWAMVRLLTRLKRAHYQVDPATLTVDALLAAHQQPARLGALIWKPLCLAALNTPSAEASAQVFANILRDTFGASATASEMLIPRIDLSELFPVPAARYLATRQGEIRTGNAITAITRGFQLEGDSGQTRWSHIVIATAPHHAAPLLAPLAGCAALAANIAALPAEPITTVYLALGSGTTLAAPMTGLASTGPAQWLFDRGQSGGPAGLLAAVISARGEHEALSHEALTQAIHAQIETQVGHSLPAPQWTQVIHERRATFACRPGIVRPAASTPLPGLWLAGDYVASDYPATLESAARAGVACARGIIASLRNA